MHSCCCTNQCKACGQCCAVPCAHRGAAGYGSGQIQQPWQPAPVPVAPPVAPMPTRAPMTEEQVRRIIREEIERGRA